MNRLRAQPGGDGGFTLVEVLVTMVIAMIVLLATLQGADIFSRTTRRASDTAQAQDSARAVVREMVSFLRQGRVAAGQTTPIPSQWTPSRSDLIVAAWVQGPTSHRPGQQAGWIRYCTSTVGSRSALVTGVRVGDAYAPAGPCSAADTTNGWLHAERLGGVLQAPGRLFDFTSSACIGGACLPLGPSVQTVGISLVVAPGERSTDTGSTIRDAVSFRNRSSL